MSYLVERDEEQLVKLWHDKIALWRAQKDVRGKWPVDAREVRDILADMHPPSLPVPDKQHLLSKKEGRMITYLTYCGRSRNAGVAYFCINKFAKVSPQRLIKPDGTITPYYSKGRILVSENLFPEFERGLFKLRNIHELSREHEFLNTNVFQIKGRGGAWIFRVELRKSGVMYRIARLWYKAGASFYTPDQISWKHENATEILTRITTDFVKAKRISKWEEAPPPMESPSDEIVEVEDDLGGMKKREEKWD